MKFTLCLKLGILVCCVAISSRLSGGYAHTAEQPGYVGNAVCARCHESIARSYALTPMANSSGNVSADIVEASFTSSGIRYHVFSDEGKVYLEYERKDGEALKGRQQLHYFIGSKAAGRSYLFSIDRYLYQAPVSFYTEANRWDLSPGFEKDSQLRLNRAVDANCLFCHASQTLPIFGTQNRFAERPFNHAGISCERCHGPGGLHVEGKARMVNPVRLEPARRDAVCSQCHLSGEARVELPGKRLARFRPGDSLSEYVNYFIFAAADSSGLKVNSHTEQLAQSMCKKKSGDAMSCLSCHDPHSVPSPGERAAYFRARCLSCHQVDWLPEGHDRASDCISCHMPRRLTVDGGHGVLTDHGIIRMPREAQRSNTQAGRLIPFAGFASDDRSLGLAYAEVALRSGDQFHQAEAFRLLTAALEHYPRDAELLTRLAFILTQRGEIQRAERFYETALQLEPDRTVALVNLGGIYGSQGRIEDAIKLWERALKNNAGLTEASVNLAQAYYAQLKTSKARAVLERALRFDPDAVSVRRLLQGSVNH
jgi:predicted CXXCH cytochrome family protein